jgi:hypothetical protein
MDQEDRSDVTWSFDAVPHFPPGLSLDNPFEFDDILMPFQLQPSLFQQAAECSAPVPAEISTKVEKDRASCRSTLSTHSTRESPVSAPDQKSFAESSAEGSKLAYSESSTIPEDRSDALYACEVSPDAAATSVSPIHNGRSAKRRRIETPEKLSDYEIALLQDLKGTTAAQSRLMSEAEHDIMLHKRRLRNRASAARSREKQRNAIQQLSDQVNCLNSAMLKLRNDCTAKELEIRRLREQNNTLRATISVRSNFFD